jgi:hypothetical protein
MVMELTPFTSGRSNLVDLRFHHPRYAATAPGLGARPADLSGKVAALYLCPRARLPIEGGLRKRSQRGL